VDNFLKKMWKETLLYSRAVPSLTWPTGSRSEIATYKETLHFGAEMLTAARYTSVTWKSDCVPQVELFVVLRVGIT
jgi:hypothetical protein